MDCCQLTTGFRQLNLKGGTALILQEPLAGEGVSITRHSSRASVCFLQLVSQDLGKEVVLSSSNCISRSSKASRIVREEL